MSPLTFDYSNGRVSVQHGMIFYSPNCSRAVDLPKQPAYSSDPFDHPRLNTSMFKQPVWWSQGWAWLSFIPLSPSFLFTPFEPLCEMPHIEEVNFSFSTPSGKLQSEIRFRMSEEDIARWTKEERRIAKLAHTIKLCYGISANAPPKPSSFHFDRAHKSHPIARRMICLAREWFAIWMGHLSYIIAKTDILVPNGTRDDSTPAPDWYNRMLKDPEFDQAWLDGLLMSTVCSYESTTPRAGIIFQWSEEDQHREPIDFFYNNNIPVHFIWSNKEEQAILSDHTLSYLRPPDSLIKEALTRLFATPSVPLAGLILQRYFELGENSVSNQTLEFLRLQYAPSFVYEFTAKQFLDQETLLKQTEATADDRLKVLRVQRDNEVFMAAQTASSLPYQGLVDSVRQPGEKLFNHFDDFFAARMKRQEELLRVESPQDRQRRKSREWHPLIENSNMFIWEITQSSRGCQMYKRVKVKRDHNWDTYCYFKSHQRLYDAFSNEWDLCEDFCFGPVDDSCDSDGYNSDEGYDDTYPEDFVSQPRPSSRRSGPMEVQTDDGSSVHQYCTDPLEAMALIFGYVPHQGSNDLPLTHNWDSILNFLGFSKISELPEVSEQEKDMMKNHFMALVSKTNSKRADKIIDQTFENLAGLFPFESIQRPSDDLFIFSSPRSNACQWVLGVHSAAAALYVCRYILENPHAHTILTIAYRLLDRGIRFRTLLPLSCSPRQHSIAEPYSPRVYRLATHDFTKADFDVAMRACQSVLSSPQGRAALLRGGIIARIAKEYLSTDVLNGPSLEVTAHRVGYLTDSGIQDDVKFCDDELTANDIAIICGTYSLYTGIQGQVAVHSWFPPPTAWEHSRSGCKWLDWTERCEDRFKSILRGINEGKARPKAHTDWISFLRGQSVSRVLIEANNARSEQFMNRMVPLGQGI